MNIEQLKAVQAICMHGTFSKAAEVLFITQPALSMQIGSLEKELGADIFERTGKRVLLTPLGKIILEHANSILSEIAILKRSVKESHGLRKGELSIAASDTVTRYLLVGKLSAFSKKYPEIQVRIWNKTTKETTKLLLEGTVDIGIVTLPVKIKGLETKKLQTYRYVAVSNDKTVSSTNHSISLHELAQTNLLLLEPGTRTREVIDSAFHLHSITPQTVMNLGSVDVQKDLAKIGAGIAIVPDFSVKEEVNSRRLFKTVIKKIPSVTLGSTYRSSNRSAALKAFLSMLYSS